MSGQLARRKQATQKNEYYQRNKDDPEYKRKNAEASKEYRHRKRLSDSYASDEIAALAARNDRMLKRRSSQQSTGVDAPDNVDVVAEEDIDVAGEDDDFEEEMELDDFEENDEPWTTDNLQALFTRARKSDRRWRSLTGLSLATYDDVFERVRPTLEATRYDGRPRIQIRTNARMSDELQYLLLAMWLRQYRPYGAMALEYDIPTRYVTKVIYRCIVATNRAVHNVSYADGGLAKPGEADWAEIVKRCRGVGLYGLENYCLAMDGMVFRIGAPPKSLQSALKGTLWNAHYSHWGYTVLDVCDLFGYSVWVSQPLKMSESEAVSEAGVRVWLQDVTAELKNDFGVLTDSLYALNLVSTPKEKRVPHMFSIGPRTLARLKYLAFDEAHEIPNEIREQALHALFTTRYIGKLRAVVENRNRQLRCWAILGGGTVFRSRLFRKAGIGKYAPEPLHVVAAVSFMLNRRLMMEKPLRASDWRPGPVTWRGRSPPDDFKCGYPDFGSDKEMVNKSVLQMQIQKVAGQYGYKSKRKPAVDDDESVTDVDNWSELDGIETVERHGMIYSNVGKSEGVKLTDRQLKLLAGESDKKGFRAAVDELAASESQKRRRTKSAKSKTDD